MGSHRRMVVADRGATSARPLLRRAVAAAVMTVMRTCNFEVCASELHRLFARATVAVGGRRQWSGLPVLASDGWRSRSPHHFITVRRIISALLPCDLPTQNARIVIE